MRNKKRGLSAIQTMLKFLWHSIVQTAPRLIGTNLVGIAVWRMRCSLLPAYAPIEERMPYDRYDDLAIYNNENNLMTRNIGQAQKDLDYRLGRQVYEHNRQLRKRAVELTLEEEWERRRLAVALHEDLGQSLAIAKIKLNSMNLEKSPGNLKPAIKEVADMLGQINDSISSLCFQMSPLILYELGLTESAEWLADKMRNQYGLSVVICDDGKPKPLSEPAKTLLFCSLRKLLLCVSKLSDPPAVEVKLCSEDSDLIMTVVFHGLRLNTINGESLTDFGFNSIRDKMLYLGGTLQIEDIHDIGAVVTLTVPIDTGVPIQ